VKENHLGRKNCGVLRVSCGVFFSETPQVNCQWDSELGRLRGFAGYYSYTYADAHARARAHMGVTQKETPHFPAGGPNPLYDNVLTCGVWPAGNPAKTPQTAVRNPADWGWTL